MSDTTSYFNKLWVIESLSQGDLKTGRSLVEGPLVSALAAHEKLDVVYRTPEKSSEFFDVLEEIFSDTKTTDALPMIHIDCHGCETGIELASKEIVNWDDVRKQFIRINEATCLNLVVVMAACYGAHILRMAIEMDRAPFWAAIGAEKEVKAGHLELAFRAFYQTFFETLSGDQALAALNHQDSERTYHFISAEGFFRRAYLSYYENSCKGKGKRERVESVLTRALQNPAVKQTHGVNKARKLVKESLGNDAQDFEKFKQRYFMFDLCPDNRVRFTSTFEEAIGDLNEKR